MKDKLFNETIKTYENYTLEYEKKWKDYKELEKDLDEFISYCPRKNILDSGCGPGRDSKYLSDKGFNVTGIDMNQYALKIAKEKVPSANFYLMDMRELGFKDNIFHGICSNASFFHIPKSENQKPINEYYRTLKKGGILFLAVKEGKGHKTLEKSYWKGKKTFYYYEKKEIIDLLEQTGFEIIKTEIRNEKENWIHLLARK